MYRHMPVAASLIFLAGPAFAEDKYSHHVYPVDVVAPTRMVNGVQRNMVAGGDSNFGIAGWCIEPDDDTDYEIWAGQIHVVGPEDLAGNRSEITVQGIVCDTVGRIVVEARNPVFSTAGIETVLKEQNAKLVQIIQALAERNDRRIVEGLGEVPSVIAANQVIADAEAELDKKLEFRLQEIEDRLQTVECAAVPGAC